MSTPDRTEAALDAALSEVQGQIARTDTKASILLAFLAGVTAGAGTAAAAAQVTAAATVVGGAGLAVLLAAAGLLLSVVRPRLTPCRGTLPHWARLTPSALREELAVDRRAEAVVTLAGLAVAKHKRLQRAVDATRAALVLLAAAAAITAGGAL